MAALSDDHDTVRVATGSGPGEAAVFRAVLSAHGIEAIMPEGGTTAGFYDTSFPVFVARSRAAEAAALIAEIRAGAAADAPDDDDDDDPDDPDTALDDDANRELAARPDVGVSVDRRRRVGVTLLCAIVLGFGTGHMSTGAWKRGVALAAVEIVGLRHFAARTNIGLGLVLVIGAILADLVGALLRIRARVASALPVARLRESRSRARR